MRKIVLVTAVATLLCGIARADESDVITIQPYDPNKWPTVTYVPTDALRITVDHAPNAVMTVNANATKIEFCLDKKCAVVHIDADRVWYDGELPVEDSARAFFEAMRVVRGKP